MGASFDFAFHGFTRHTVVGGRRQHSVFRSQPALTGILLKAWHALLYGRGAHHAGVAELYQYGAGRISGEIAGNTDTSQLVSVTTISTLKRSEAHTSELQSRLYVV